MISWNRYYDPFLGRYLQNDPLGLDAGMNFFVYASNSPLNYIDYMGLEDDDFYDDYGWGSYGEEDTGQGYNSGGYADNNARVGKDGFSMGYLPGWQFRLNPDLAEKNPTANPNNSSGGGSGKKKFSDAEYAQYKALREAVRQMKEMKNGLPYPEEDPPTWYRTRPKAKNFPPKFEDDGSLETSYKGTVPDGLKENTWEGYGADWAGEFRYERGRGDWEDQLRLYCYRLEFQNGLDKITDAIKFGRPEDAERALRKAYNSDNKLGTTVVNTLIDEKGDINLDGFVRDDLTDCLNGIK